MATMKNIRKNLCNDVFSELSGVKEKLIIMRNDLVRAYGNETKSFGVIDRHLRELIDQVDWKLQIMSHECSYDWTGSADYEENTVSVGPADSTLSDFSGGYLGG